MTPQRGSYHQPHFTGENTGCINNVAKSHMAGPWWNLESQVGLRAKPEPFAPSIAPAPRSEACSTPRSSHSPNPQCRILFLKILPCASEITHLHRLSCQLAFFPLALIPRPGFYSTWCSYGGTGSQGGCLLYMEQSQVCPACPPASLSTPKSRLIPNTDHVHQALCLTPCSKSPSQEEWTVTIYSSHNYFLPVDLGLSTGDIAAERR